jgi:hypothetical protein
MGRTTKLIAAFSCLHGLLAMTCLLLSFGSSMRSFDGGASESTVERVMGQAANVLFLPASLVWTRWASENLPNAVEWLLLVANSAFWGLFIGSLVARVKRPAPDS